MFEKYGENSGTIREKGKKTRGNGGTCFNNERKQWKKQVNMDSENTKKTGETDAKVGKWY